MSTAYKRITHNSYPLVGCEYVIALTHMRTHNDIRLAENVPEVDLILGGHDMVYEKRRVGTLHIYT